MRVFLAIAMLFIVTSISEAGGFVQSGFAPSGALIINNNNNNNAMAQRRNASVVVSSQQRVGLFGRRQLNNTTVVGADGSVSTLNQRFGPRGRLRAQEAVNIR